MPKYFITMYTGYCGSDGYELIEATSLEEANEYAYDMAVQHAESYGYEFCPEGEECEDPECEFEHEGSASIEGIAVLYIPEKHDMYLN
jgi:hypothetical protein